MISNDSFERIVSDWFHADAEHRVPDHLDAVLRRTSTERQRPAWSSLERWLPMDTTFTGRTAPSFRQLGPLVVAALVLLALIAALLLAGSRGQRLAPYGPALGGLVAQDVAGDIVLVDPVSGRRTVVSSGPEWDSYPSFSPDGTKLIFVRSPIEGSTYGALMVANADGTDVHAVTEPILNITSGDWSGDGAYIAITASNTATPDPDDQAITVVDIKRGTSQVLELGMSVEDVTWIPPRGEEILFHGLKADQPEAIWVVRPDGTGLHALTPLQAFVGEDYHEPMVSPNGRLLAYHSWNFTTGVMEVVVRDLVDGTTRTIPNTEARADLFVATFSPDSRSLLLVRQIRDSDPPDYGGVTQLMLVPADGSDGGTMLGPRFPFKSVQHAELVAAFTVDGSRILLIDRQHVIELRRQLWTLPVDGGPMTVEPWDSNDLPSTQRVAPLGVPGPVPCPSRACPPANGS
jgi:Tol biopolymer transport system component